LPPVHGGTLHHDEMIAPARDYLAAHRSFVSGGLEPVD
jgi:hypothetical protein